MTIQSIQSEAISRGARMLRTALGPTIARFLEDPAVIEVMLNPDGRLWIDRDLVAYAEILAAQSGQSISEPNKLISLMLARFMATDRAFIRSRKLRKEANG